MTPSRYTSFVLAGTVSLVLLLAGCSDPASDAPPNPGPNASESTDTGSTDTGASATDEPALPADFPQDVPLPDGALVSADGGSGSWTLTREIALIDQVTAAVSQLEKSYGFVVTEATEGPDPRWALTSDRYDLTIAVRDGDPNLMDVTLETR